MSVGIAGCLVLFQGDNLFYLEPHHLRPAVPLRSPLSLAVVAAHERGLRRLMTRVSDVESGEHKKRGPRSSSNYFSSITKGRTIMSTATSRSHHMLSTPLPPSPPHAPLAPSPLQRQFSSLSADSGVSYLTASIDFSGVG